MAIVICAVLHCPAHAQKKGSGTNKKDSKWPYLGSHIPPYLALAGGYEGLKTNNFHAGLMVNACNCVVTPAVGGMAGGGIFYKQNTANNKVYSLEAELGFYGGLALGCNYNYNVTTTNKIHGIKPFVGFSAYNFQLLYGYSFYNSKSDLYNELRHNRITLRYVVPVIKLKKKKRGGTTP
ncbi:MAG: hypothetical protein V4635_03605 [Bacteroidota bacterium]